MPATHNGVAVADFDGDGRLDAFVAGWKAPNRLLIWGDDGVIRDGDLGDAADENVAGTGAAACDVDGDGTEEIYSVTTDGIGGIMTSPDKLYRRATSADGTKSDGWTDVLKLPGNSANQHSGLSAACVARNDGRHAVAVANYGSVAAASPKISGFPATRPSDSSRLLPLECPRRGCGVVAVAETSRRVSGGRRRDERAQSLRGVNRTPPR